MPRHATDERGVDLVPHAAGGSDGTLGCGRNLLAGWSEAMTEARATLAVIVPNYNYSRYIRETVAGILAQTVPFDEVIVVDDGSTDNSLEILSEFADRANVLSIANSGQLGACRAGLAVSSSDYLYFLDADDLAEPDLVECIRPLLTSRPVKVQFQLDGMDDFGALQNSAFPTYPASYNAEMMRADNEVLGFYICPPTSGNVYSRQALLQLDLSRFDPRGVIDGSPTLALPYLGDIVSVNRPHARYRIHASSMSAWSKPSPNLMDKELAIFWKSWEEVKRVIGQDFPQHLESSLYVLERRLMTACLSGRRLVIHLAVRYVIVLLRTQVTFRQKVLSVVWAAALLLPSPPARNYLIRMKRSSVNRSGRLQTLLNLLLGVRRRTRAAAANVGQ